MTPPDAGLPASGLRPRTRCVRRGVRRRTLSGPCPRGPLARRPSPGTGPIPPRPLDSAAPPASPTPQGESLAHALARGAAAHPDLGLASDAYEAGVLARLDRRRLAAGLAPTEATRTSLVGRTAFEDLHLVLACDAGLERAWEALAALAKRRLEGTAIRRGLDPVTAEAEVADLLGDLASPPPDGTARTRLASYDGSGALLGWLTIVLVRRLSRRGRGRRIASLDASPVEPTAGDARVGTAAVPAPEAAAAGGEAGARFAAALASAWGRLSPQERLALALKHRDGLSQREVGERLGVGEARISRVVSSGVQTLGAWIRSAVPDGVEPGAGPGWSALLAAVSAHWARIAGETSLLWGGGRGTPSRRPTSPRTSRPSPESESRDVDG